MSNEQEAFTFEQRIALLEEEIVKWKARANPAQSDEFTDTFDCGHFAGLMRALSILTKPKHELFRVRF